MIFFTAVNDIKEESKYFKSILSKVNANELIWGITELSNSTFEKINSGDYICFYHKFNIIGICKVKKTKIDKVLSNQLFGYYNHKFKGGVTRPEIGQSKVYNQYFQFIIRFKIKTGTNNVYKK